MSLLGAISAYRRLDTQQKAFIKNSGIHTSMSAHRWIRFLEPLCRFDEQCDRVRGKVAVLATFAGFGTFLSIFASAIMESPIPFAICGTIFIFFLFLFFLFKRKDLNNNIRNTLYPLINILSVEVGNKQKITAHIKFKKDLKKKDIIRTPRSDRNHKFYSYDVMNISCVFKDGTKLAWKVNDTIRRREKKNPRGKLKIKFKLKRRVLISLAFNSKHYQLNSQTPKAIAKCFKKSEGKLVYKHTFKHSAEGKVANIPMSDLLDETRRPYRYLAQNSN